MHNSHEIMLRDARDDERAAIKELTLAAYAEFADVMEPAAWAGLRQALHSALATTEPAEWIVAESGGALIGSVMLFPPAANAYGASSAGGGLPELRLLAVAPSARGRGVGAALVEECLRRAKRMGAAELGLHTSKSLRAAIRMYERMGFVRVPSEDFQAEGTELIMAYRLVLPGN